jgi:N-carbamoylputrescine amidase
MKSRAFTLGLIQMRCTPDPAVNLRRAGDLLRDAARRGAEIACLPELFRTPYFCQTEDPAVFDLAEPIPGPTSDALAAIARETNMVIVGSVFERRAAGVYHNSVVVLDAQGKLRGTYRKMHIPDDPLYYEKYYFTPGDLGFQVVPTDRAAIGTLICWDQWFPEAARMTALQGAEALLYPTAIGWHPREKEAFGADQLDAWRTIQRAHAIASGVYVAAVNRVGHEGPADAGIEFWGHSFVADPFGRIIAEGSLDKEEIVTASCDLAQIEETRRHWPFLRDRRIDAYAPITQRYLGPSP